MIFHQEIDSSTRTVNSPNAGKDISYTEVIDEVSQHCTNDGEGASLDSVTLSPQDNNNDDDDQSVELPTNFDGNSQKKRIQEWSQRSSFHRELLKDDFSSYFRNDTNTPNRGSAYLSSQIGSIDLESDVEDTEEYDDDDDDEEEEEIFGLGIGESVQFDFSSEYLSFHGKLPTQ